MVIGRSIFIGALLGLFLFLAHPAHLQAQPQATTEESALVEAKEHLASGKNVDELLYWDSEAGHVHGNLLHKAVLAGHNRVAAFLLNRGANVNNNEFEVKGALPASTPLGIAAWAGNMDLVKMLVANGADASHKDLGGLSPLWNACALGDVAMADFLLSKGATVKPSEHVNWTTPIHVAAEKGHILMVQLLVEKGADVNTELKARYRHTPLHLALEEKFGAIATFLILQGANVQPGKNKQNALIPAAALGDRSLVELMIHRGAPVNGTYEHHSPIGSAVEAGHLEVVEFLLAKGAALNPFPSPAKSPLHSACRGRDFEWIKIVRLLLSKGADVRATDYRGNTPLHEAKVSDMVELLIQHGAGINARNKESQTPLHVAARYRHAGAVGALLKGGADTSIADKNGETPIQMTKEPAILKLFKNR